ncbi:hypothetical protein AWM70_10200 [Paenibacillus yonginensis]|uniref:Uncharacterized protein n=1 Tax=Paenibacillus yonginensis TaxID=1462996 RepID=A0A1B1N0G7_9BACL|nr:hypothetical protein [Paenibacillus yonginensis]ANS74923.1 hypothetical protein AWM70_10200 [Paenibacillus yonginensis]
MDAGSDKWLMIVMVLVILFLLWRTFSSWLSRPAPFKPGHGFEINDQFERTAAVELLERSGYEVVSGKLKVPLTFDCDGERLYSRLYIDYVVSKDGAYYVVKEARDRQPMDWTGSGVRKALLPFLLLYPDCEGMLYINGEMNEIRKIRLANEEEY